MPDRALLFRNLADAQQIVTASEGRIRAQRRLITQLELDGLNSSSAKDVLDVLKEAHARYVETRDQIRGQLSFR
jgi:hypothetical protein